MTENDTFAFDPEGNAASALGFSAVGVHAGFRADPERLDMALVVADEPCAAAATFTTNVFCAAPVRVSREHLNEGGAGAPAYGCARAVVVNSGIANAATGEIGLENARKTAELVGEAVGCPADEVLVASTGVIGQHLRLEPFAEGVPAALAAMAKVADDLAGRTSQGATAARAIMTTDTCPKHGSVSFSGDGIGYPGVIFTVGGMCKGAGMIMPNMATMIAVITTDAPLAAPEGPAFTPGTPAFDAFQRALDQLATTLARKMAADGEGATRLITVTVRGAATADDADAAARTVANSPLVKTAVYGHDANWGRVAAALGRSGARFNQEDVDIDILGLPVCRAGLVVDFDEEEALRRFEEPEVAIEVDLHAGEESATMWTCDFSHEYVTINGDYRS